MEILNSFLGQGMVAQIGEIVLFANTVTMAMPTPFPQCNAVRTIDNELMVVGGNPFGYVFFAKTLPIAFRTDHNRLWNDLVKKSCVGKGCE